MEHKLKLTKVKHPKTIQDHLAAAASRIAKQIQDELVSLQLTLEDKIEDVVESVKTGKSTRRRFIGPRNRKV